MLSDGFEKGDVTINVLLSVLERLWYIIIMAGIVFLSFRKTVMQVKDI